MFSHMAWFQMGCLTRLLEARKSTCSFEPPSCAMHMTSNLADHQCSHCVPHGSEEEGKAQRQRLLHIICLIPNAHQGNTFIVAHMANVRVLSTNRAHSVVSSQVLPASFALASPIKVSLLKPRTRQTRPGCGQLRLFCALLDVYKYHGLCVDDVALVFEFVTIINLTNTQPPTLSPTFETYCKSLNHSSLLLYRPIQPSPRRCGLLPLCNMNPQYPYYFDYNPNEKPTTGSHDFCGDSEALTFYGNITQQQYSMQKSLSTSTHDSFLDGSASGQHGQQMKRGNSAYSNTSYDNQYTQPSSSYAFSPNAAYVPSISTTVPSYCESALYDYQQQPTFSTMTTTSSYVPGTPRMPLYPQTLDSLVSPTSPEVQSSM